MKKIVVFGLLFMAFFLQFCSTAKKAQAPAVTSYDAHVKPIIANHCSPCHISPDGKIEFLDTYEAASSHIDDILERIQKNPGEKGFMPFKHPKLPDSTIQVFVKWRNEGMAKWMSNEWSVMSEKYLALTHFHYLLFFFFRFSSIFRFPLITSQYSLPYPTKISAPAGMSFVDSI